MKRCFPYICCPFSMNANTLALVINIFPVQWLEPITYWLGDLNPGSVTWEGNDDPLQYSCLENPMDRVLVGCPMGLHRVRHLAAAATAGVTLKYTFLINFLHKYIFLRI